MFVHFPPLDVRAARCSILPEPSTRTQAIDVNAGSDKTVGNASQLHPDSLRPELHDDESNASGALLRRVPSGKASDIAKKPCAEARDSPRLCKAFPSGVRVCTEEGFVSSIQRCLAARCLARSENPAFAPPAAELSAPSAEREGLTPGTYEALTQLDDRLVAELEASTIRLVRSAWLIQQPADFQMPYRQELEALEEQGESPSPLLSADEAVALVRRGRRAVAVLSHGWLSPGNPDPACARLHVVQGALGIYPHLEALFWDYSSLFQHPPNGRRTPQQNAAFGKALDVMGDLYASSIGTTVLQIAEVPPRPAQFDGAVCLFDLAEGVEEAQVLEALGGFGQIISCRLCSQPAEVRFAEHQAALAATAAAAQLSSLCAGIATLYNERSYEGRSGDAARDDRLADTGRGWCCFESAVSSEVISRLGVYPKLRAELSSLPPKMLVLSSAAPPAEQRGGGKEMLGTRVERITTSIENASSPAPATSQRSCACTKSTWIGSPWRCRRRSQPLQAAVPWSQSPRWSSQSLR